ncbi:MAG: glycosyl hydrolase 115 family protein, partial [Kiritimatiellae bacterium]|nr:glycosyl hydrolase 115 family protein [Kiritimatiellia bacterium]
MAKASTTLSPIDWECMMQTTRNYVLAIAVVCPSLLLAAAPFRIGREAMPRIVVGEAMRPFVMRAAQDVAGDIEKIFGTRPEITTAAAPDKNAIVLSRVGEGWENYAVESMPGNVLKITGSDDGGVMFGLYRFASECLGVDPFYYWSGIEPAKAVVREWNEGISIRQGDPSFKFRGWFINDEDFLNGFRPKENGVRKIDYPRYHVCFGPALADKIYETAVRAGFNTMICASYVDILNPDEKRLVEIAASRGLYVTMHHQEPVGAGALQLDMHFPEMRGTTYASHPDLWRKAWRRYVGEWAKVPDVIWQLGLRGRRDLPFWMTFGALNAPDSPEEEEHRRAGLISSAMAEQLEMIEEALGRRPEHFATQLWMEGAEYYRRGLLKIPDGTTVIFSDNCPGLKFQGDIGGVKSLDLKKRFGLYYHLALVHGNHHCELVPPLRTHQVLGDAWRKGARELVLFNVSNVRPFLYTIASAGEMTRDMVGFKAAKFRDRWASARFGAKAAPAVARAIDLYFAAYETEPSRDARSSYGSPCQRAPLAILNDGRLCDLTRQMVARFRSNAGGPSPVVSQYESDPDRLTDLVDNLFYRVNQDMFPDLCDWPRLGLRARLQAAAFARCAEQLERASDGMDEARKRLLFERFGYPTEFMRLSSECLAEITCAVEAKSLGDMRRAVGHAKTALACAETRDELICRYNSGKWEHWYDRDIIYPCAPLAESLRNALWKIQDEQSFDLSLAGDAVERVDFGPEAAGGYAEFEVHGMDAEASNAVLRVAYACHPNGLSEKGDFWRETSARYLGPNVDLPILPANIDRYELYTLDHVGRYRAKLLQGLVRYARFSLDSQRGAVAIRNFRLVNDKVHSEGEREGSFT